MDGVGFGAASPMQNCGTCAGAFLDRRGEDTGMRRNGCLSDLEILLTLWSILRAVSSVVWLLVTGVVGEWDI